MEKLEQMQDLMVTLRQMEDSGDILYKTTEEMVDLLVKHGGTGLARGAFSTVYGGEELHYVVKINRQTDEANTQFMNMAEHMSSTNSVFPKTIGQFQYGYHDLNIYIMEYVPVTIKSGASDMDTLMTEWFGLYEENFSENFYEHIFEKGFPFEQLRDVVAGQSIGRGLSDSEYYDMVIRRICTKFEDRTAYSNLEEQEYEVLRESLNKDNITMLLEFFKLLDGLDYNVIDIHPGNYGFREDGSLVIFDPVA